MASLACGQLLGFWMSVPFIIVSASLGAAYDIANGDL
jgi:hypothetical protein